MKDESGKFVQTESSEKLAYSLPRRRRTKGAKATKVLFVYIFISVDYKSFTTLKYIT